MVLVSEESQHHGLQNKITLDVLSNNWRERKLQTKEEDDVRWYILPEELIFKNVNPNQNFGSTKSKLNSKTRSKSQLSINKSISVQLTQWSGNKTFNTGTTTYSGGSIMDSENVAIFKQKPVWVHRIEIAHKFVANSAQENIIRKMRRTHFANVARFFGLCPMDTEVGVLCEIAHRGNLADAMQAESIKFDNTMKNSAVSDVTSGLMYLHSSGAVYHGELSCGNCLIDNRFVVKLAYFRLDFLPRVQPDFFQDAPEHRKFFTYSPEQLRTSNIYIGSKEGDIYAYGHVLVEIMCEIPPFQNEIEVDRFTAKGIIDRICRQSVIPFRPKLPPQALQSPIRTLVEKCWDDRPQARPTIEYINGYLKSVPGFERDHNFVDDLFKRLATYAEELEQRIRKAQEATYEEKRKAETLLFQVLPQQVANALTRGIKIDPEFFNQVTIGFTGIEDFVYLTSVSSPIQIVVLLNEIYSLFDGTLQQFDVYKVETIADTYMIASGVPMRNGDGHSTQIAELSLELMREAQAFKIKHRPRSNNFLLLKIGCHTGSCVAGVIGNRMPRYCLFGDAVNFASRMTMYGQAFKIQLSASAKEHLERYGLGNFRFQSRGLLEIKGKGPQKCFWLVQKHEKEELPWEKGYRPERTKDTSPSESSEHLPATRQNTIDRDETGSQKTQQLSVPPAQASRYPKKPSETKTGRNEKKKESSPAPSKRHEEDKASPSQPKQSSKKSTVEPNKETKSEDRPRNKKNTEQLKQLISIAEQKPASTPLLPSYGYQPADFSPVKAKNEPHKGHELTTTWITGRSRADTGPETGRDKKTHHAPDIKVRDSLGASFDATDNAPHPDYSRMLFNQTRRQSRDSGKNVANPSRATKKDDPGTGTKPLDTGRGTKHLDLEEARKVVDVLTQKSARKPSHVAKERRRPETERNVDASAATSVDHQASKDKPDNLSRETSGPSSNHREKSPPRRSQNHGSARQKPPEPRRSNNKSIVREHSRDERHPSSEQKKFPEPEKSSKKSMVRRYSSDERKLSPRSPNLGRDEKKGHRASARHSVRSSSQKAKPSQRDEGSFRHRDARRKVRSPSESQSASDKSFHSGSSSRHSPVALKSRERRKSRRSSSVHGKRDRKRKPRDERRRSSTSVVEGKISAGGSDSEGSTSQSPSRKQLHSWASRQDLSGREDKEPGSNTRSKRKSNRRDTTGGRPERKSPSESDADTVTWV